jgi:predicted NBD/HSP70 family sugar kinase
MSTILVVDIGGTSIKIGFVVDGQPQDFIRLFSTTELRADPIASLVRMISTSVTESGLDPAAIVSTVPGFLDAQQNRVLHAANIPELNGLLLATELEHRISLPVSLERDSVLALMGEYVAGVCQGAGSVLGLFFGTGVGGAFLQQGVPFRGSGWALEIGHMPFSASRRWLHAERGECLEAYVSGKALQRIAEHHQVPIEDVFKVSAQASELSTHRSEFVTNQCFAIATAIAVLSPETVLLGGGICEMRDFPKVELVKELVQSFPFLSIGRPLDLRWASLGWRSVLHGATFLVRKEAL